MAGDDKIVQRGKHVVGAVGRRARIDVETGSALLRRRKDCAGVVFAAIDVGKLSSSIIGLALDWPQYPGRA